MSSSACPPNFVQLLDEITDSRRQDVDCRDLTKIQDFILSRRVPARDAINTVITKISNSNSRSSVHAVAVLESCIENCSSVLHNEISTDAFFEHFCKVIYNCKFEEARTSGFCTIRQWRLRLKNNDRRNTNDKTAVEEKNNPLASNAKNLENENLPSPPLTSRSNNKLKRADDSEEILRSSRESTASENDVSQSATLDRVETIMPHSEEPESSNMCNSAQQCQRNNNLELLIKKVQHDITIIKMFSESGGKHDYAEVAQTSFINLSNNRSQVLEAVKSLDEEKNRLRQLKIKMDTIRRTKSNRLVDQQKLTGVSSLYQLRKLAEKNSITILTLDQYIQLNEHMDEDTQQKYREFMLVFDPKNEEHTGILLLELLIAKNVAENLNIKSFVETPLYELFEECLLNWPELKPNVAPKTKWDAADKRGKIKMIAHRFLKSQACRVWRKNKASASRPQ